MPLYKTGQKAHNLGVQWTDVEKLRVGGEYKILYILHTQEFFLREFFSPPTPNFSTSVPHVLHFWVTNNLLYKSLYSWCVKYNHLVSDEKIQLQSTHHAFDKKSI